MYISKYDDPVFFEKYGQMSRSRKGLAGAGEWPTLRRLMPALEGKKVLDVGCGYGWHCRWAADHGAASVVGIDLSVRMLEEARRRHSDPKITYRQSSMEEMDFPAESFDLVLSSLAFHYTADFGAVAEKIHSFLKPGGTFLFSCEHPVFTAQGPQDWEYDDNGAIRCFPVDHYFQEGVREAVFLGEPVTKYHRTLTTYLSVLLEAGFRITAVEEPMPPAEMRDLPGMKDEMRRPMMLIIRGEKRK